MTPQEALRPAHPAPARAPVAAHDARVLGVRPLSPRALAVRIERPAGFDFAATRVASLLVGGERRTFTIASAPGQPWLEFATLRGASPFKQALAALRPGDAVQVKGPYGHFDLDAARPAVMLAGHVGIAPFHAFLEHAARQGLDLRGTLLHAAPEGDTPYAAEVAQLAARLPGVRVVRAGPGGLAQAARFAERDARYYIAGAPSEVAAAAQALEPLALPRDRVKVELFHGYP